MAHKFQRGDIVSCAWIAGILYGEVLSISDTFMHLKVIMSTNKEWENEIVSASPDEFILYRPAEKSQNGGNRMAYTFKVGDIVRGISDGYGITNKGMTRGKVVEVGAETIRVKLLEHTDDFNNRTWKGICFNVLPEHLELVNPDSPVSRTLYNPPATVVFWSDGTKTVAKCAPHEQYDREKGLAIACAKKLLGERYADAFKEFREPVNRVLTMDEVHALENGTKVYVEIACDACYGKGVHVKTESRLMSQGGRGYWAIDKVTEKELPISRWARAWLLPRKPTAAELGANPWKWEG